MIDSSLVLIAYKSRLCFLHFTEPQTLGPQSLSRSLSDWNFGRIVTELNEMFSSDSVTKISLSNLLKVILKLINQNPTIFPQSF